MLSGRRYRLEPTTAQAGMFQEFGAICRAVWNAALDQRRQYVDRYIRGRGGQFCGYHLQARELAEAKREEAWMKAAPSHILQQTLKDLDTACRTHGTFNVRWRAKHRWAPSLRFPAGNRNAVEKLNRRWARAKLPKLGWVKFRMSRPLGGRVRSATVSRQGNHWFVSFLVEDGRLAPEAHTRPDSAVGVDRGVAVAATTSEGGFHDRRFATGGEKQRYLRLQRKLARQKKGSANRTETIAAMNRITGRAVDRRTDFCAYTASRLARDHALVALEDLNTRGMTASAKGTVHEPGARVRQKTGMNRSILDKGWRRLETALNDAARYTGIRIVKVEPAYTSQTCHACKRVDAESRESQAVFACTSCGHRGHADVNAAKNILSAAGHAVPACGDLGVARSTKQEPEGTREEVPLQPTFAPVGIPRL